MTPPIKVPKGLAGVAVTESRIAKSDPDGTLIYRGYPIRELAENASFEEVACLVLDGALPNRENLESFSAGLRAASSLDERVLAIMRALPRDSHPIDVLRTACSALGSLDRQSDLRASEISIASKMSVLAANCFRLPRGESRVEPLPTMGFAANFLKMCSLRAFDDREKWVFERVLIFYMEHDLNASSYTVRVVASTRADPYAAVTAGLAALKGPLHGGANEASMEMVLRIGKPERAASFVEKELGEGRKVVGFGHRVYKSFDPRARLCKEYLGKMAEGGGTAREVYGVCDALEREMWQRKKIPPNLDFYAAPIFYSLGIPIPLFTPIFAGSRVFGWLAHYNEQLEENKLIRPDADYVGPADLKYVPIDERKT